MLFPLPGISTSISEAVVRSRAEREAGEEWKTLRRGASQPGTRAGNLPAAGGHSSLSVRSQRLTHTQTFTGTAAPESRPLHPFIYFTF